MAEFKINNATVRIHGEVSREKVEAATVKFLKRVEEKKRKKAKERKHHGK